MSTKLQVTQCCVYVYLVVQPANPVTTRVGVHCLNGKRVVIGQKRPHLKDTYTTRLEVE